MSVATPLFNPTIESVKQAFDHWRATRSKRAQTPINLQRRAAALLSSHPASHICRALKINDTALKRWAADASATPTQSPIVNSPFIELTTVPALVDSHVPGPHCTTLSVVLGDGIQLCIDGQFTLEQILSAAHQHQQGVRS